jgi:hypothetical protein
MMTHVRMVLVASQTQIGSLISLGPRMAIVPVVRVIL